MSPQIREMCLVDQGLVLQSTSPANADKTEFIVFGAKANLERLNQADVNLRLDSAVIHPSESLRDLGVQLDSHLPMRDHIAKIAS